MNTAYLYENFITRNIRFSNATALKQADINATKIVAEVEGCYVTNTSSYVDVMFASNTVDTLLYKRSYIRFINGNDNTTYLAFIDRIEPNNFNPTATNNIVNKAYRIFITVDWWSTIMWNDTDSDIYDIKHSLEGNVERAHVDDVLSNGKPTLEYTTTNPEFPVNRFEVVEHKAIQQRKGVSFVYIIATKDVSSRKYGEFFRCVDKQWGSGLLTYFAIVVDDIELQRGKTFNVNVNYTVDGVSYTQSHTLIANTSNNIITDGDVVAMYILDNLQGYDGDRSITLDYGEVDGVSEINPVNFSAVEVGGVNAMFINKSTNEIPIQTPRGVNSLFNTTFSIPQDYNTYLDIITKQYFEPYVSTTLCVGDEEIVLDMIYTESDNCCYLTPNGYGTGYVVYKYERNLTGEAHYYYINDNSAYPIQKLSDVYTVMQGHASLTTPIMKALTMSNNIFSVVQQSSANWSNVINESIEFRKRVIRGENGGTSSSAMGYYAKPARIQVIRPLLGNVNALRKDLALYGYNTFLHPHEVLTAHERKYFNYIKCNNAQVAVPNYTTEIRLQIEEMFNNGVWLWNTASNFGNFEVPNYPIIMEN